MEGRLVEVPAKQPLRGVSALSQTGFTVRSRVPRSLVQAELELSKPPGRLRLQLPAGIQRLLRSEQRLTGGEMCFSRGLVLLGTALTVEHCAWQPLCHSQQESEMVQFVLGRRMSSKSAA